MGDSDINFDCHFFGFTQLYMPDDNEPVVADIACSGPGRTAGILRLGGRKLDKNKVRGVEHIQGTGGGFSAIFGPGGEPIATMPSDKEGILYANVDVNDKLRAKQWLDVVGHYSRPDLLSLRVNTHPSKPVFFAGEPEK
ncbi:hypothetical protein PENFLA_c114G06863 [Penicillium flavigenum]|uniref:CN hydrolase domain-containing protein n=1 Tax=Penicillium flavigenum TaxID=254877 RepID=A0A1V6S5Y9_9EURO|nr:hypothetical protein PENFLA_c114G06863 [Penicillium flavigenum]